MKLSKKLIILIGILIVILTMADWAQSATNTDSPPYETIPGPDDDQSPPSTTGNSNDPNFPPYETTSNPDKTYQCPPPIATYDCKEKVCEWKKDIQEWLKTGQWFEGASGAELTTFNDTNLIQQLPNKVKVTIIIKPLWDNIKVSCEYLDDKASTLSKILAGYSYAGEKGFHQPNPLPLEKNLDLKENWDLIKKEKNEIIYVCKFNDPIKCKWQLVFSY